MKLVWVTAVLLFGLFPLIAALIDIATWIVIGNGVTSIMWTDLRVFVSVAWVATIGYLSVSYAGSVL